MDILVGADPEVFMFQNGKAVSAFGAIQGTKDNPFKVKDGAVQVDGMALEFNIDPAMSAEQFKENIRSVMRQLQEMVPGYELNPVPVAHFGFDYINTQPKEAVELGCNPDFNAWYDGQPNPKPDAAMPFRTGAGHVHIGWTNKADIYDPDHRNACIMVIKQMDYYLGLGSLLFDADNQRRQMYGAPGAFRYKPYGCEYRVLSNAWLKDDNLIRWVFDRTVQGVNKLYEGDAAYNEYGALACGVIKSNDVRGAKAIMRELGIPLPV